MRGGLQSAESPSTQPSLAPPSSQLLRDRQSLLSMPPSLGSGHSPWILFSPHPGPARLGFSLAQKPHHMSLQKLKLSPLPVELLGTPQHPIQISPPVKPFFLLP